jgi:tetratricopeptide (TPR) repeat protein
MPRQPSTHVDSAAAVGKRVKEARTHAGLSQQQLSFEGCTAAYVSRIEAGARIPSFQVLREFARKLNVSAEYLATGHDEQAEATAGTMEIELLVHLGDTDLAQARYEELIASEGSPALAAAARAGLGQMAFRAGEHEEAIPHLQAALASPAIAPRDRITAIDALGRALAQTARFEEATALFERHLAEATEADNIPDRIRFSVLLANTLIDRANFGGAEDVLSSVLDTARAAVDPVSRAGLYWSQSRLHSSQNRPDLAAEYARLALETLEVTEHSLYIAKAFVLLAQIENERGRTEEALHSLDEALPLVSGSGNKYEHGLLLLEKARVLIRTGAAEEAAATALGATALFEGASPVNAGRGFSLAAQVYGELGDDARAIELYELAVDLFPVADRHRVDALSAMAELYEAQGRTEEALAVLKQAVQAGIPVRTDAR